MLINAQKAVPEEDIERAVALLRTNWIVNPGALWRYPFIVKFIQSNITLLHPSCTYSF